MKKRLILLVSVLLMVFQVNYSLAEDNIKINMYGEDLYIKDQGPILYNDRTLVPIRVIFERLGLEVSWDADKRVVTGKKEGLEIYLQVDSNISKLNKKEVILDAPASIINDRVMVPLRFIAESCDKDVEWDQDNKTVRIKEKAQVTTAEEFLNAIESNKNIYLANNIDISEVMEKSETYDLKHTILNNNVEYDGENVVITNIENLSIIGIDSAKKVQISISKEYLNNVMFFENCENLKLENLEIVDKKTKDQKIGIIKIESCYRINTNNLNSFFTTNTNTLESGEIIVKTQSISNNKLDGETKIYYKNGNLMCEAIYKDGYPEGLIILYYESGIKAVKAEVTKGDYGIKPIGGRVIYYYNNGNVMINVKVGDDFNFAEGEVYNEKGTLLYNGKFENGKPISMTDEEWSKLGQIFTEGMGIYEPVLNNIFNGHFGI
ncbi:MAG TPA: hypothetical protein DEP72_00485 [Clostridiales bacterium]|nr:MAG: hypothetical protein A2Y18_03260 [Clostridiales bacterium GWD2_32_19]HCC06628.1 hypothetical protein [Clostridiales bacterium]